MLRIPIQRLETSAAGSRKRGVAVPAGADSKSKHGHIPAPFDLRGKSSDLSKHRAFFDATFPGNKGYALDGFFLYVYLSTPPQPLPQTFAGVPVVFVPPGDGVFAVPPPFLIPPGTWVRRQQGSIAENLNYRDRKDDWQPLFEAVRLHFASIQVPITEVIYWGYFLHIILEHEDTVMARLPSLAGKITCRYIFEKQMKRPSKPQARRRVNDTALDRVVDDTTYDILQTGVRVSSNFLPDSQTFLSSTLGARIWDADGNDYVTVAAYGFPDICGENVFHALREDGRLVGRLAGRIGTTDVALMRLSPGEQFSDETFVSDVSAENDESPLLCGLRHARQYDLVSLDSPDTGYLSGQVMANGRQKIPSDGDTDEQGWVAVDWVYQFQGAATPLPDSMCGTVVVGEDKKVLSFFQYAFKEGPFKGWCVGTSADELLERGFH